MDFSSSTGHKLTSWLIANIRNNTTLASNSSEKENLLPYPPFPSNLKILSDSNHHHIYTLTNVFKLAPSGVEVGQSFSVNKIHGLLCPLLYHMIEALILRRTLFYSFYLRLNSALSNWILLHMVAQILVLAMVLVMKWNFFISFSSLKVKSVIAMAMLLLNLACIWGRLWVIWLILESLFYKDCFANVHLKNFIA